MAEILWQALALVLLLAALATGYRFVVARHGAALAPAQRLAVMVVVLTATGGAIGAPFWWFNAPAAFAWPLPPLAGRMLAAAGVAFALACGLALRRPEASHLRLIGAMLALYLAPLTAAIVLAHLDRFDFTRGVTWGFFVIVVLLLAGCAMLVARPAGLSADSAARPGSATTALLGGAALLAGVWGLALFLRPQGPVAAIWLWPQDALTSRLIGAMFLTVAGMALAARHHAVLAQTALTVIVTYGTLVSAAGLFNLAAAKPLPVAYLAFWAVLAALALWRLLSADAAWPSPAPSRRG